MAPAGAAAAAVVAGAAAARVARRSAGAAADPARLAVPMAPAVRCLRLQLQRAVAQADRRRQRRGAAGGLDPSGMPPVPAGGPGAFPIHAAAGVEYGEGFAGNAHRHAPDSWLRVDEVSRRGARRRRQHARQRRLHADASRGGPRRQRDDSLSRVEGRRREGRRPRAARRPPTWRTARSRASRRIPETIALLVKLGAKNNNTLRFLRAVTAGRQNTTYVAAGLQACGFFLVRLSARPARGIFHEPGRPSPFDNGSPAAYARSLCSRSLIYGFLGRHPDRDGQRGVMEPGLQTRRDRFLRSCSAATATSAGPSDRCRISQRTIVPEGNCQCSPSGFADTIRKSWSAARPLRQAATPRRLHQAGKRRWYARSRPARSMTQRPRRT